MQKSGLDNNIVENIFRKFERALPKWIAMIEISFLPEDMKQDYIELITNNLNKLRVK